MSKKTAPVTPVPAAPPEPQPAPAPPPINPMALLRDDVVKARDQAVEQAKHWALQVQIRDAQLKAFEPPPAPNRAARRRAGS
jgi:hypothetical protein